MRGEVLSTLVTCMSTLTWGTCAHTQQSKAMLSKHAGTCGNFNRGCYHPRPSKATCVCTLAVVVQILGKAEFLNPGGSVKDRVALRIVQEALVRLQHPTATCQGPTAAILALVCGDPSRCSPE
jgi:hypothetical protein